MLRQFVLALAALVCLGASFAASADEGSEAARSQAKDLTEKGLAHYNLAEYGQAIEAFRDAYRLSREPELLFDIAQAYRLAKDCTQAHKFYKSYLREAPGAPNRAKVEARIVELEACAAEAAPSPPAATTQPAAAPPPVPPPAEPPPLMAPAAPAPPPVAGGRPPRTKLIIGLATAGAGLVAGGAAVYYGLAANDAADEVDQRYREGGAWTTDDAATETRGMDAERTAVILSAVSAIAVVGGAVLTYLGSGEEPAGRVLSAAPLPGGASMGFTWTF